MLKDWLLNSMLLSPESEGGGGDSGADTSNQGGGAADGSGGSEAAPPTNDGDAITDHDAGDESDVEESDEDAADTDESTDGDDSGEGDATEGEPEQSADDDSDDIEMSDLRRWALGDLADQETADGKAPENAKAEGTKGPDVKADPLLSKEAIDEIIEAMPEAKPLADALMKVEQKLAKFEQFAQSQQQREMQQAVVTLHGIIDEVAAGDDRFGSFAEGLTETQAKYRTRLDATALALAKRAAVEGRRLTERAAYKGALKLMPKPAPKPQAKAAANAPAKSVTKAPAAKSPEHARKQRSTENEGPRGPTSPRFLKAYEKFAKS